MQPFRISPSRLALSYIALSVLVLALFAVPLWYAWSVNMSTFREYVPAADVQRMVDLFGREGPAGLAAAIESKTAGLPRDVVVVLADPSKVRIAGNVPAWPAQIPDLPGTYGLVINVSDSSMRVVVSHVRLPGGYHLLIGRESARFQSLVDYFWFGIAAATLIVLVLGGFIGWMIRRALLLEVREMSRTAAAIVDGDLSRRLPTRRGSDALATLARTVNGMLEQLAGKNEQLAGEIAIRRQAEQALQRAHENLEGLVAQRTDALRRSEERYALAVDAAGDGHSDWIVATDEFYASPRLLEMCGLPADTMFAGRADFLRRFPFHPEDRERVIEAINTHFACGTVRLDMDMRILRHGEMRWLHLTGLCSRDPSGALVRWNAALTDVTERKRAEASLSLSEGRYARAMEAAEEGHWEWDMVTDEMFLSAPMKEMLGFAPEVQFTRRADFFAAQPIHPDDRQRVNDAREASIAGTAPRYQIEYRIIPRPGELRWVRSRGKVFYDDQGRPLRITGSLTDITERRLVNEALRHSEERHALAMAAAGEGYWDWNIATDEYFTSPRMLELYGFPPGTTFKGRADFLARFPFHPEDRPKWEEAVAAHFAGKTARFDMEIRMIPRGETRWIHLAGVLSRDASGKPVRWTGSVADITERRSVEDALRLSEHRYALAMEATGDGHWDWNIPVDKMYVSPLLLEICGLPADTTFTGRSQWVDRFPFYPGERPKYAQAVAEHFAGKTARVDIEIRIVPRGETRWVHMTGRCSRDASGKPIRWAGSVTDITVRKRVDDELRARQDMLDLAQKAARAVAFEWRIGAGEGENRWSPDLEAMYGLAPGTYDGSYESWKKLVYPEDWPAVREAIKAAQESGDVATEYRVVHNSGTIRWLQAKGRLFFDAEGRPERLAGFMLDVTDRHLAEEELRRMEAQLRHAQGLEAMGTLAGGIAHDFNNLLGAILGYGEMALRDAPAGSRLRRDVESIMVAGERARALVDRILAYSRSGIGERVAVHVQEVVRETLDLVTAKLPPGISIEEHLNAERAAVLGDATQIHQVLMNLVTNAAQAMPNGGTLRVSLDRIAVDAPRVATMGAVAAGDYIVLDIADTGCGMPAEVLERIFDPFFTTKVVGVGTGLGLSLVHGIVAGLNGAIDVATTVGKGSTFTVYLPRAGDVANGNRLRTRAQPEMSRGQRERILVVDDEESLVKLATETLTELGYEPVGFTSSIAALAAFTADAHRFDAVITDESMPGMAGSELIREVRTIRPAIPILLVSGYLSTAVAQRARKAGATDVLKKPLSAGELASSLARVLHPTTERRPPRAMARPARGL